MDYRTNARPPQSSKTFVRVLEGYQGLAYLYQIDREDGVRHHVVVSAARVAFTGPETYIFSSDENGEVLNWGELPGSYRGGLDHSAAISGYLAHLNDEIYHPCPSCKGSGFLEDWFGPWDPLPFPGNCTKCKGSGCLLTERSDV